MAAYLGATLESVVRNDFPGLELIVVDGGSADGSVDIIRRYEQHISWWCSEPDDGQYAALNKGFEHATGEILAWLGADDLYFPWTLATVGSLMKSFPKVDWLTSRFPVLFNADGVAIESSRATPLNPVAFYRGHNLPIGMHHRGGGRFIQQESTFWRRGLWERCGARLDESVTLAADFDLWARFFEHAECWSVEALLAGFRRRTDQRSSNLDLYRDEATRVLARYGQFPRAQASPRPGSVLSRIPGMPLRLRERWGAVCAGPVLRFQPRTQSWIETIEYFPT